VARQLSIPQERKEYEHCTNKQRYQGHSFRVPLWSVIAPLRRSLREALREAVGSSTGHQFKTAKVTPYFYSFPHDDSKQPAHHCQWLIQRPALVTTTMVPYG
jgi:hypothetical protein